jgi:Protein of unknown function, DUF488
MELFTIGHSNHSIETFITLLQQHEITVVADVRSHPYSRYVPHFNPNQLKSALADLVTVSLSMPHTPPDWDGPNEPCWKLIAAIIEFSKSDLIWMEMERLGWSVEQGRNYLQRMYGKRSRKHLTDDELFHFLSYLKSV